MLFSSVGFKHIVDPLLGNIMGLQGFELILCWIVFVYHPPNGFRVCLFMLIGSYKSALRANMKKFVMSSSWLKSTSNVLRPKITFFFFLKPLLIKAQANPPKVVRRWTDVTLILLNSISLC